MIAGGHATQKNSGGKLFFYISTLNRTCASVRAPPVLSTSGGVLSACIFSLVALAAGSRQRAACFRSVNLSRCQYEWKCALEFDVPVYVVLDMERSDKAEVLAKARSAPWRPTRTDGEMRHHKTPVE